MVSRSNVDQSRVGWIAVYSCMMSLTRIAAGKAIQTGRFWRPLQLLKW
jgi:hypothetical protein